MKRKGFLRRKRGTIRSKKDSRNIRTRTDCSKRKKKDANGEKMGQQNGQNNTTQLQLKNDTPRTSHRRKRNAKKRASDVGHRRGRRRKCAPGGMDLTFVSQKKETHLSRGRTNSHLKAQRLGGNPIPYSQGKILKRAELRLSKEKETRRQKNVQNPTL